MARCGALPASLFLLEVKGSTLTVYGTYRTLLASRPIRVSDPGSMAGTMGLAPMRRQHDQGDREHARGNIGLRASDKVSGEDYLDVPVPTMNAGMEQGNLRLVYVLGDEADYNPGAVWADTKIWSKSLKGWERVAVVSDADLLGNAAKAFGWLMPGEVKVFEPDDVRDAKQWLVGIDDD